MAPMRRRLALLACLVAGCGDAAGPGAAPSPALRLHPDALDFGTGPAGAAQHQHLVASNVGGEPLAVSRLSVGAPFAVWPASLTLAPGDSAPIRVTFANTDAGRFRGRLEVELGAGREAPGVALRAEATAPAAILVEPLFVDFGAVPPGDAAERRVVVENRGGAPLRVEAVTWRPPFRAHGTPVDLAPGARGALRLTYAPKGSGEHAAVLKLRSDDPEVHTVLLSLTGRSGAGATSRPPAAAPGALPGVVSGSVRIASHREPLRSHHAEGVAHDPTTGRLELRGLTLPTVELTFDRFVAFEPTTATGTLERGGAARLHVPLALRAPPAAAEPVALELTTGVATAVLDGVQLALRGRPVDAAGTGRFVGVARLGPDSSLPGRALAIELEARLW